MSPVLQLGSDLALYAGAIPLVAVFVAKLLGRDLHWENWLIAAACAVSFVQDVWANELLQGGRNNWWLLYLFAPLQLALFAVVVMRQPLLRWAIVASILALAALSAHRGPLDRPETLLGVGYGGLLAVFAWFTADLHENGRPLAVYLGGTVPGLVAIELVPPEHPGWLAAWLLYQVPRVVALVWLSTTLVRPRLALLPVEVRPIRTEGRRRHGKAGSAPR